MNHAIEQSFASLLAQVRAFISAEVLPLEHEFLSRPFSELLPALQQKRAQVKTLGWWTPQLPKEYGGVGLTLTEFARLSEEVGRTPLGHYLFHCPAPEAG